MATRWKVLATSSDESRVLVEMELATGRTWVRPGLSHEECQAALSQVIKEYVELFRTVTPKLAAAPNVAFGVEPSALAMSRRGNNG